MSITKCAGSNDMNVRVRGEGEGEGEVYHLI